MLPFTRYSRATLVERTLKNAIPDFQSVQAAEKQWGFADTTVFSNRFRRASSVVISRRMKLLSA